MATPIINVGGGSSLVATFLSQLQADLPELLLIFGGIIAISLVLAFIDQASEMRWLDKQAKYWKGRNR